jgi:hypothetical protein
MRRAHMSSCSPRWDRKRGKGGQQKVTVEHVHVHQGAQAIVGNTGMGGQVGIGLNEVDWRGHGATLID